MAAVEEPGGVEGVGVLAMAAGEDTVAGTDRCKRRQPRKKRRGKVGP